MTKISEDSDFNLEGIKQILMKENQFLTDLVDTIPAKIYFDHHVKEKILSDKHALMDEKVEALRKRGINHAELSSKSKHKRARLDPLCQKSVSEIHEEMDAVKKKRRNKKGLFQPSASITRAGNIEELQQRLQEKIQEFRTKRKVIGRANPDESKRLQRKMRKLKVKANKIEKKKQVLNPYKDTQSKKEKKPNIKPVYNKDADIIYSKLDFSENGSIETKKSEFTGKNYKKLLKKAEMKREKIETLKTSNPELANSLLEKEKWKKAILKSENIKIKDDPELLKKSIKKQEKIKNKRSKEWKERIDHVEAKKQARQEKRTKNIKKRKEEKLGHKIKKAKKKGRVIPGF